MAEVWDAEEQYGDIKKSLVVVTCLLARKTLKFDFLFPFSTSPDFPTGIYVDPHRHQYPAAATAHSPRAPRGPPQKPGAYIRCYFVRTRVIRDRLLMMRALVGALAFCAQSIASGGRRLFWFDRCRWPTVQKHCVLYRMHGYDRSQKIPPVAQFSLSLKRGGI